MSVSYPLAAAVAAEPLGRTVTPRSEGVVLGAPRTVLRWEGAALLAAAAWAYGQVGAGWGMFALLFLVPDVSMLGYLAGRRIGAISYNLGHSTLSPAALGALGVLLAQHTLVWLALIWLAHIGFDRMLGYGLKYADAFGHTHLGLVGKLKSDRGKTDA